MDYAQIVNLLQQYLPANLAHKSLEVLGALALVKELVPRLSAWGVPASGRAADATAKFLLNSPLRGLVIWQAPNLIAFLDSLTGALTQILDTFRDELKKDLQAAEPVAPILPVTANETKS